MKSSKIIAGVDEVGRGSLIGSVYSAAVILGLDSHDITGLVDSKKISEKKRIVKANNIILNSLSIAIGVATKDEIDSLNIHHATNSQIRFSKSKINHWDVV